MLAPGLGEGLQLDVGRVAAKLAKCSWMVRISASERKSCPLRLRKINVLRFGQMRPLPYREILYLQRRAGVYLQRIQKTPMIFGIKSI